MRAAQRGGVARHALAVLAACLGGGPARLSPPVARYTELLLERHLRSTRPLTAPAAVAPAGGPLPLAASADFASLAASELCSALPPPRRLAVLAAALPPLLDGTRRAAANLAHALPLLEERLARPLRLLPLHEGAALLDALLARELEVSSPPAARGWLTLDVAACLHQPARTSAASAAGGAAHLDARLHATVQYGPGFAYSAWLEGALCGAEAEAGALLDAMARRVGAGWEVAEIVQEMRRMMAAAQSAAAESTGLRPEVVNSISSRCDAVRRHR